MHNNGYLPSNKNQSTFTNTTALIKIYEDKTLATSLVTVNEPWITLYSITLSGNIGDLLRIRGQMEMTNENKKVIRGHSRIAINGQEFGTRCSQNCVYIAPNDDSHHVPLWVDAGFNIMENIKYTIELQFKATSTKNKLKLNIENRNNNYGHLIVEHFRPYASINEVKDNGGYGLLNYAIDDKEQSTTFGAIAGERSTIYEVKLLTKKDDIVRLFGQTTSKYLEKPRADMHGHGIYLNNIRISQWSTENTPWSIQTVPLYSDAFIVANSSLSNIFSVKMHGIMGNGGDYVFDGGHLIALHFRKQSNNDSRLKYLYDIKTIKGSRVDEELISNSGWIDIISHQCDFLVNDLIKINGFIQLEESPKFKLGVNCSAEILLIKSGKIVGRSSLSQKYMTKYLEHLPLYVDHIHEIKESGVYNIILRAMCLRRESDPVLSILGGRSQIIIDHYR